MTDARIITGDARVRSPAIRYHGAKFRLASWLLQYFPPHDCYVEPYGGAAGVLVRKPRAYAEVYNDLDGDIVNFFRVLRDPETRAALIEQLILTPFARKEFEGAWEDSADPVERARRTAVRATFGWGSSSATKGTTGFRIDTKREYALTMHLWTRYPDAIRVAGERFAGVLIENRPAIECMLQHDGPRTLHFVDPPYVHSTRVMQANGTGYYRHEMTDMDHVHLLAAVQSLRGMVIISGYPTDLYDQALTGWRRQTRLARASAGRGTAMRTEVIWINQACAAALELGGLPLEAA